MQTIRRNTAPAVLFMFLLVALGCADRQRFQTVMVPPRIDLARHELIGVVDFDSSARGKLGPLATRRFTEWARKDQGMVRIVNLGSGQEALRSVDRDRWDPQTYKVLGRLHGIRTILTGQLNVSSIKPDLQLSSNWRSGSVSASVDAGLEVEMIETETGASIWSSSARAATSVGHVSVFGGKQFSFDAADPERAYGNMIDLLVDQATRDFRATWEQRPL